MAEGLGNVHVALGEGLGPGAGGRFRERRLQSQWALQELHRAGITGNAGGAAEQTEEGRRRLSERLLLNCRVYRRFLHIIDDLAPEACSGSAVSSTTAGTAAGVPPPLEQLRGPDAEVLPEFWDGLLGPDDSVFLEHGFLAALEEAGCVSLESGWQPRFLLAKGGGRLVGAVPLYLKMHSNGEFCEQMDWASYELDVPTWPRLFVGVPFTPHRGRRLIAAAWLGPRERAAVEQALLRALVALSERAQLSVNMAFGALEEGELLRNAGFVEWSAHQAWWVNRQPEPYRDFGDFLNSLRVKNARQIERQRRQLALEGLEVEVVDGAADARAISADLMSEVYRDCYVPTQARHGHGNAWPVMRGGDAEEIRYDLSESFFRLLAEVFAHRVLLVLARRPAANGQLGGGSGRLVGGSLCFAKGRRICGRYWGYPRDVTTGSLSTPSVPFLHFECCYHRLVEHAIEHGYSSIEPGNGGGSIYKVQRFRGFEPEPTPSYHLAPHPELRQEFERLAENAAVEGPPSWTASRYSAYAPARRCSTAEEPQPAPEGPVHGG